LTLLTPRPTFQSQDNDDAQRFLRLQLPGIHHAVHCCSHYLL